MLICLDRNLWASQSFLGAEHDVLGYVSTRAGDQVGDKRCPEAKYVILETKEYVRVSRFAIVDVGWNESKTREGLLAFEMVPCAASTGL
jgi:hypothetical protein